MSTKVGRAPADCSQTSMNLILCTEAEAAAGTIVLEGERAEHVRCVHRAQVGDRLRVGVVNQKMGEARLVQLRRRYAQLEFDAPLEQEPPVAHPLSLAIAMCRPPSLQKALSFATSMGVKRFWVFHCRRSEKSFWDSHSLTPGAIEQCLWLGLEQARDTVMPEISWHRRFRPFAEDLLAPRMADAPVWVADPLADEREFLAPDEGAPRSGILVIGPEGGFVPYEREKFRELGARGFSLGPRILRVEVATVSLLSAYSARSGLP